MKTNRDRRIEDYLVLPYRIEVLRIPEDKGGGYTACLPQFGRLAVVGDGETIMEAIADLEESKRALFEEYLEEGLEIPEPDAEDEEFSGKFMLRIPKYLHKELSIGAKRNAVSLNQYVNGLLAKDFQADRFSLALESIQSEINMLREHVCELRYKMESTMILPRMSRYVFASDDLDNEIAA